MRVLLVKAARMSPLVRRSRGKNSFLRLRKRLGFACCRLGLWSEPNRCQLET
jgi:hypothetical protein